MRKSLFTLLSILAAMLFTACGNNGGSDEPKEDPLPEHAVLIYMPYTGPTNNLYTYLKQNIEDMKLGMAGTSALKSNQILVYMAVNSEKAVLFRLVAKDNSIVNDTLKQYRNPDPTSVAGIASIMGDMKAQAQARTYSLIIGCHGEGWLPRKKQARPNGPHRYFGGTRYEYQANMETLDSALVRTGIHTQYILFDDCYIATVETAYALKGSTDYLVGCTSEIMAQGIPYKKVINYLLGTSPNYQALCDGFYDYYMSTGTPYGNLSAIDCREVDAMAQLMKEANSRYQYEGDTSELQDLDVLHWDPTIYFDFLDYARSLCKDDALYEQIAAQMQRLVPYKKGLPKIYSSLGDKAIDLSSYCGISISDPSENDMARDSKKETGWWKATH